MKKNLHLIIALLTIIIEFALMVYGMFKGFDNIIYIAMLIIAIVGFGSVYLINRKYSIYGGKFKDHFGE